MRLRDRRADDIEALVAIAVRVHEEDGYPVHLPGDDFVRFLTRPEQVGAWVAEHGGRIVGQVALTSAAIPSVVELARRHGVSGPPGVVVRLLVDPAARRLGCGARLLEHVRRAAVARGLAPMLDVLATPASAPAVALYRRAGWRELGG